MIMTTATDPEKSMPSETQRSSVLDGWLTRKQLSDEIDVAVDTLARWASDGIGPKFIRVGAKVYYRREAVRSWMQDLENRRSPRGHR